MAGRIRILHVDEDAELRHIVAISLGLDSEIETIGVARASEALAHFGAVQDAPRPHLVLLDLVIGMDDGIGLLADIRAACAEPPPPAAFLTGRLLERDMERMRAEGALAIFPKPFNPLTLAREVRDLIDR